MADQGNLRVAVIGLGYFSQFHLRAWQAIPETELIAVCDLEMARVHDVASSHAVAGFTDTKEVLRQTDPDIVDIVAPPPSHRQIIEQAVRPGRLIICQKPFCQNVEEAQMVIKVAKDAGCHLIVHENFRFQPWHRQLKRVLEDGLLGEIYQARFSLRPGDGRGPDAYLHRQPAFQKMTRFLVHETAVHLVDVFRWLFGPVSSVYADLRQLNPHIAGEDAGLIIMEHAGGVRTVFDGNRLSDHSTDNPRRTMGEMDIEGENGTIRLDGYGRLWFREFGQTGESELPIDAPVDEDSFGGGSVESLCRHAVSALRTGQPFENGAQDYLTVMRVVDATYVSAERGEKISLK